MPQFILKLFDNIFIRLLFLSLPFTYALTIDLKFPLKISEVVLIVILILTFQRGRISAFWLRNAPLKAFFVFLVFTFFSLLINSLWTYSYQLSEYDSRFGYTFDSVFKFFYLLLAFFTFFVATNAFKIDSRKYIALFLKGGIVAGCYSWYLFFAGLLRIQAVLLPGIDEPQYITLSFGTFIRGGTFKEGNYMGLFILFCVILSFYSNRKLLGYFFTTTLIATFSSVGIICVSLFLAYYYFSLNFTRRKLFRLSAIIIVLVVLFGTLFQHEDFKFLIISKISISKREITNNADYSREDRMNSFLTAIKMGLDNPFMGVGISNYARHFDHLAPNNIFKNNDFKVIPNNIYAEIFAETGFFGLIIFLYLLFLLYEKTRFDNSGILKCGYVVTLIYFLAFPTFSMLFIWVFFALINSLENRFNENSGRNE
jgi:O-antigen ligase